MRQIIVLQGASDAEDFSRYHISVGADAKKAVQYQFNPSGLAQVDAIKLLGAALIQQCDEFAPSRELSIAKTEIETAVMWAVKGVIKDAQSKNLVT